MTGNIWKTDYSEKDFVGGGAPLNFYVYLGNNFVKGRIKRGFYSEELTKEGRTIKPPEF